MTNPEGEVTTIRRNVGNYSSIDSFTTQKSLIFKKSTWQTQHCSLMPEYFIFYRHHLLWMSCNIVTEWAC